MSPLLCTLESELTDLWAMMIEVRPSVALLRARMMLFSVIESRLEVASSNTRMGEFLRMARAMATLCFSPPLSLRPRSPTWVE